MTIEGISDLDDARVERLEGVLRRALTTLAGDTFRRAGAAADGDGDDSNRSTRRWARFVVESMSPPRRCYHGADHVFQVMESARRQRQEEHARDEHRQRRGGALPTSSDDDGDDEDMAILALAAAFHDVVYLPLEPTSQPSRGQLEVLAPHVRQHRHGGNVVLVLHHKGTEGGSAVKAAASSSSTTCPPMPKQWQLDMVCRVFGALNPGSNIATKQHLHPQSPDSGSISGSCYYELNPNGSSEFLSALAAVQCVGDALAARQLFRLAACIEASIPFRRLQGAALGRSSPPDRGGNSGESDDDDGGSGSGSGSGSHASDDTFTTGIMEELFVRWSKESDDLGLGLSEADLVHSVRLACRFAHADLGTFASPAVEPFVDSTWNLLPEWSPQLLELPDAAATNLPSSDGPVSVRRDVPPLPALVRYEEALVGLLQRYPTIDPQYVFPSFRGSYRLWAERTHRARRNLERVGQYAKARLACLRVVKDALKCLLQCGSACPILLDEMELRTLRFLRLVEFGVPREALSELNEAKQQHARSSNGQDQEDRHVLWRCLTNTGDTLRSPCSWGDAVAANASALVYASLSWDTIVELSTKPARGVDDDDSVGPGCHSHSRPGDLVRLLPKPARRLLLDSLVKAATTPASTDETAPVAIEELRESMYESLDCTAGST